MKCRHDYETLQQTIKNGFIVADVCRCVKCGVIRRSEVKDEPPATRS
jgi:hypothetical protein